MKRKKRKQELDFDLAPKKRTRNTWSKEEKRRRKRKRQEFKEGLQIGITIGILIGILIGLNIPIVFKHCGNTSIKTSKFPISQENKVEAEMETIEIEQEIESYVEVLIAAHMIDNPASGANRNNNLAQVARDINCANNPIFKDGYILKPGEKFSWLEIVGNPTKERGYLLAGEMENGGKSTTGTGGGICQVAIGINSAVQKTAQSLAPEYYHAEHHSGTVRYVKPQRGDKELTITYKGNRDFSFVSTLPNTIRIFITTEQDKVYVQIFEFQKVMRKIKRKIRVPKKGA